MAQGPLKVFGAPRPPPSSSWPHACRDVSRFGLEHPVPGAGSCFWPQPSLFSWGWENAGVGVWLDGEQRKNYMLVVVHALPKVSGAGSVVNQRSRGLTRKESWVLAYVWHVLASVLVVGRRQRPEKGKVVSSLE